MHDSPRNRRRLPPAPMLLIVLAVTTGWMQPATPTGQSQALTASRSIDDRAVSTPRVEIAAITPGVDERPPRPLPTVLEPAAEATTKTVTKAATKAATAPRVASTPRLVSARNHFWMPALGISRPVYSYPCSRTTGPANFVYRWGCAGRNNVYLLGHAWGVFKPLHDAYVAGRLRVGMIAMYADGNGRIRKYRITEWRVVDPVDSNWAVATQSVPSMTLQTCVGPNGQYRLNVRLVAVN